MNEAKFVISKSKVLSQYELLKDCSDIISYSSKTNSIVSEILEQNSDAMFSIHFVNELKHIKDMSRVIFLGQALNQDNIGELINKGIRFFVIDNISDLNELMCYLDNNDVKINLLLRLKLKENTLKTEKYFVFGIKLELLINKINKLRNNNKINQLGIHFHRKTQNMSEWNLKYELSNLIGDDILEKLDFINIGGGLPGVYANTNVNVITGILTKIKELKQWLNSKKIKLIIEPGRFIAAPSAKLITRILNIYDNNIIVNASVYNSDMDALIVPVKLIIENELDKKYGKPYVVKGITPCSMDLFRYRVYLNNPKKGDELIFLNAGAYNFTTDFCDLPKLKTEVVE